MSNIEYSFRDNYRHFDKRIIKQYNNEISITLPVAVLLINNETIARIVAKMI